jgi:broad specificity phosphatase PhoE
MVKKYYIFRHGETFVTKGHRLGYGTKIFSANILDSGKPALEKLGRYLKEIPTDFNAASQYKRCRQTVGIISGQSGKEFIFDKRLNEFFFELPFLFRRRVISFLNELDRSGYETVLICTHAAVINEIMKLVNREAFRKLTQKGSLTRPPLQVEASRKALQLQNLLRFTKYLSPGVLLTLTKSSAEEINFNQ